MQVVFGWELDGLCFPETVAGGAATLDAAVVGPRGLLGLLETRLGLRRLPEQRAVRIAQYLALLNKVDDKKQFYSGSLRLDPWATADRLLQARDELVAAGWNRKSIAQFPKIVSLAVVEEAGAISPGFGERLEEVISEVERIGKSPIDQMILVGGTELLPKPLERLIGVLQRTGAEISEVGSHRPGDAGSGTVGGGAAGSGAAGGGTGIGVLPVHNTARRTNISVAADSKSSSVTGPDISAAPKSNTGVVTRAGAGVAAQSVSTIGSLAESISDLDIVRRRLTTRDTTAQSVRGDGSFVVIDADDELQAAEMVATWLAAHPQPEDIVIIRGEDSSALNQACQRFGLPQIGSTTRSEFRSVLQVLPFAFEMAWRPIDPKRLAEFLTLDGGPIPFMVARHLLDALAEQPGIGGPLWREAWKNIYQNEVESALSSDASKARNAAEHEAKEKLTKWQEWFEVSVSSFNENIPISEAVRVCRRVAQWALTRSRYNPPHRLYEIAVQHARLLAQLLNECGSEAIPQTQLRKMVGAVTGYGVTSGTAECANWSVLDRPGQIWGAAPTVIWWQFAQPGTQSVKLSVWSSNEIDDLARLGIYIDSPLKRLRRESFASRAPLIHARERIILVKPRMVAGQDAIPHPLWDEICSLVDENQLRRATIRAAQLYSKPAIDFAGFTINLAPCEFIQMPTVHRNWQLPAGAVTPRERDESFSSIDKLLGCSLAWVLEYRGYMRQPKPLDLSQKDMLIGKLAHAVIDAVYTQKKKWSSEEARQRAEAILEEYIPERAATLLLPGAGPQLRQAKEAIPSAIEHLTRVLNEANLRVDDTEVPLSARFSDNRGLAGNADMLAYTQDNVPVVLDFKWSSSPLWHRKKIAKGQALQLAVYAYLALHLKGATGDVPAADWAPVGYFMLRGKEIYFTKDGVFPPGSHVRKQERSLKETFDIMVAEYERELAAVVDGHVTAYGVDPDNARLEDFMRKELTEPPCRFCNLGYICGKRELQ